MLFLLNSNEKIRQIQWFSGKLFAFNRLPDNMFKKHFNCDQIVKAPLILLIIV